MVSGKLVKHIEYANKKGITYIGFVGETEVTNRVVRVKNLQKGEQKDVSITDEMFFRGL